MSKKVIIAVDAMGGEGSPKKIIEGIKLSLKSNKNTFFNLFGDSNLINKEISNKGKGICTFYSINQ